MQIRRIEKLVRLMQGKQTIHGEGRKQAPTQVNTRGRPVGA